MGFQEGDVETCEQVTKPSGNSKTTGTIDELLAANTEGVDYEVNAELTDNIELRPVANNSTG